MKFLRLFGSTSQRDAVLASIDYKILQKTEGVPGVGIAKGTWVDPKYTPFYIEDISGSTNTVQIMLELDDWCEGPDPAITIEKSTDGTTWETMGTTSTTAITATIPANGKLYLRCNTTAWGYYDESNEIFSYNYINTTGNCNIGGNIMSLLYGSDFTGNETTFPSGSTYTFYDLFYNNTHLVDASNLLLPATTLADYCYSDMFNGCTSLTSAPASLPATTLVDWCYTSMFYGCSSLTTSPVLPATTLAERCYNGMFNGCTALTAAPALPATTLAKNCYTSMFYGCSSLTTSPVLPATTLASNCYNQMFGGCTSLTTAPVLPATTLADYCYSYMFINCSSLTTAPVLPATTLVQSCYLSMFYDCTNLNYIKCLATDISAISCTTSWLSGVAASGTFIKNANMSSWSTDENGIPSGWTVQDVFPFTLYAFPASSTYGTVNGSDLYMQDCNVGDHVTLTVAANQDYTFVGWEGSYGYSFLSGVGPTFEFDVTQAIYDQVMDDGGEWYLSASYVARQVNVSLVTVPNGATTSISGVGQMSVGSETYLNFEYDDNHWLWLGWSTSSSEDDILVSRMRPLRVTANEDTTLYTLFRYKQQ